MRSLSIEQLLFLALFLLVPLLNLIVQWLRRRGQVARPEAPGQEGATATAMPPPVAGTGPPRERHSPREAVRAPETLPPRVRRAAPRPSLEEAPRRASPEAPLPPGSRRRRSFRIGTGRELQRAIVLMAILGPSRAQEASPAPDDPWPPPPGPPPRAPGGTEPGAPAR